MAATYEPIATTTLGSAAATIDFTSIPATFTDLRLVWVFKDVGTSNESPSIRFNSDTGSNYSRTTLRGDGSIATSTQNTSSTRIPAGAINSNSTQPHINTSDYFNYAGSTYKTCLIESSQDNNGSGSVARIVGLWRSSSAITSISIYLNGTNMAAGTTATLYGILKA
jgi:hypothetical protein